MALSLTRALVEVLLPGVHLMSWNKDGEWSLLVSIEQEQADKLCAEVRELLDLADAANIMGVSRSRSARCPWRMHQACSKRSSCRP